MCGIAGIFDLGGNPDQTRHDVAAMTETLIHRGPDDGHIVYDDGCALGARRLAIQDLSQAGRQPTTRRELTIAYHGEGYNLRELRRERDTVRVGWPSGC